MSKSKKNQPLFNLSKAFQELEEINTWFQEEDIDLEEALKKYERGIELIKECKKRIGEVENKVVAVKQGIER